MKSQGLADVYLGVVSPMANEAGDAVRFVKAVLEKCSPARKVTFFAVLDKATTDNSVDLLRAHQQLDPRLKVVWAPENRGVVDAYVRGYQEAIAAGCDWILEIDAGFSHDPEEIPQFFKAMENGYDCVFGSRFMPGGSMEISWNRYLVSRGGTIISNFLLGTKLWDMTSGFELFSRRALEMVLEKGICSRAHFFQTEIKVYCQTLRFTEVPIHYRSPSPRLGTPALQDAFRQLWRLVKLRWFSSGERTVTHEPQHITGRNLDIISESRPK